MPEMDFAAKIQLFSAAVIPILFGIALHEVAHGWVARACGDRTAEMMGRLSLNPLRHIDPVGTVLVPFVFGVLLGLPPLGWAKPVPVVFRNLRNPRTDMMKVAVAGPLSNLLMAIGWAVALVVALRVLPPGTGVRQFVISMAQIGISFNVLLAVFNLFPIPPLDGGRVLRGLVSPNVAQALDRIEPYGLIIVVGLLAAGLLDRILGPLVRIVSQFVLAIVGA